MDSGTRQMPLRMGRNRVLRLTQPTRWTTILWEIVGGGLLLCSLVNFLLWGLFFLFFWIPICVQVVELGWVVFCDFLCNLESFFSLFCTFYFSLFFL